MTSKSHLAAAPEGPVNPASLAERCTLEVAGSLPADFQELERFVGAWALATQQQRNDKRVASTMGELQEFYDALLERIKDIAAYLDQFPISSLPVDAVHLLYMGQMLMEIAPAVEVMKSPDIPSAYARERLIIHPQTEQFKKAD
jgi:hypothetical protein